MRILGALLVCVATGVYLPAPAVAGGGGAVAPDAPGSQAGGGGSQAGGGSFGTRVPGEAKPERGTPGKRRSERHPARRRGALLTSFAVRRRSLYLHGRPARIRFTLSGRRAVRVRLHVLSAADRSRVATLDLGPRRPGEHSVAFTGLQPAVLAEGRYLLHIAGKGLRRAPTASSTAELRFSHHAFPVAGRYDWGGDGSRFGARRDGHRHQGQDLAAAEGTPVVAPRGGEVEAVQYQARGAGHYVVVDGADEDRDYVFMHLRSGSIPVQQGDRVRTGQKIGEVGTTGGSTGPHLHFEVWVGGWFDGGEPIDPLPLLQSWA